MKEYRISKYDPQFRVNGSYQKNEWTSISDIGKVFDDGVLTLAEYLRVENEYIQFWGMAGSEDRWEAKAMKSRVRLLSDYSLLIMLSVAAAIATAVSVWMVVELDPQTVADPKDRHSMQWFFIVVGAIYDIATGETRNDEC